jgi:3-hydroxyisobutyrate dehydrogenase-like beta-hydroxyacid dehydrogenase
MARFLFLRSDMTPIATAPTIGFYGLGALGYALAGRLARAGYPVSVADPRCERVERWASQFGEVASHPAHARCVIACLADESALRDLALGCDGLFAAMRPGRLLIDHTARSPDLVGELAASAAARAVGYVGAPLAGTPDSLVATLRGAREDVARARAIVSAYAECVEEGDAAGRGVLARRAERSL